MLRSSVSLISFLMLPCASCLVLGDFSVDPTKIPFLSKGISARLWIDLEGSGARAAGAEPVTCEKDWACSGGTRWDFILGWPLAAAALRGCWVDGCRWIQPHLAVCASFGSADWSAKVCQPVKFSSLRPVSHVSAIDQSRSSRSAEGRDTWEIHDDRLQIVPVAAALAIGYTLPTGDVHHACEIWSGPLRLSRLEGPCLPGVWSLLGAWSVLGLLRLVGPGEALSWACRRPGQCR